MAAVPSENVIDLPALRTFEIELHDGRTTTLHAHEVAVVDCHDGAVLCFYEYVLDMIAGQIQQVRHIRRIFSPLAGWMGVTDKSDFNSPATTKRPN